MDNIGNYFDFIKPDNMAEEKTVKVARLILLLIKIEKELYTVKTTLTKLKSHQQESVDDSELNKRIHKKLETVELLLDKIRKARLNLNYYFI